jgi:hypothetical protein
VDENRFAGGKETYKLGMSPSRRTSHAVYDLKYQMARVPKYRKIVLTEGLGRKLKVAFQEIAERYEFEIPRINFVIFHGPLLG